MKLVLMEDLHIQPSEIEKLDKKTQWKYYYYCVAKRKIEDEKIKDQMKNSDKQHRKQTNPTLHFPDDFVSQIENKITIMNLEDE